ncbi:MAG: ribosomal-processing cysteine protease Prp [Lachnospiraceae bacterium]|nr:ribosomal-processing cysteine protease Prp [Lachnospiraceae bacterium]
MITAMVLKHNNRYQTFMCKGHSGLEDAGKDIVCSAVSILVINTANSLEKLTGSKVKGVDNGSLRWDFIEEPDEKGQLLMDSLVLGLESIEKEYGNNLKLIIEEV